MASIGCRRICNHEVRRRGTGRNAWPRWPRRVSVGRVGATHSALTAATAVTEGAERSPLVGGSDLSGRLACRRVSRGDEIGGTRALAASAAFAEIGFIADATASRPRSRRRSATVLSGAPALVRLPRPFGRAASQSGTPRSAGGRSLCDGAEVTARAGLTMLGGIRASPISSSSASASIERSISAWRTAGCIELRSNRRRDNGLHSFCGRSPSRGHSLARHRGGGCGHSRMMRTQRA